MHENGVRGLRWLTDLEIIDPSNEYNSSFSFGFITSHIKECPTRTYMK
jgi:hypothetical protein